MALPWNTPSEPFPIVAACRGVSSPSLATLHRIARALALEGRCGKTSTLGRLAGAKARAALCGRDEELVVGADTVVVVDGAPTAYRAAPICVTTCSLI